jgi:hypothetical protein
MPDFLGGLIDHPGIQVEIGDDIFRGLLWFIQLNEIL